jgi:hypothetical protein
MSEQSKRIVMLAGLAEWAARYQEAAELLFHSPTEYVEWVDGFRTDFNRGCRDDETMYWVNADDARQDAVKAISARFQLKAAE